jgi:hypothetical protein
VICCLCLQYIYYSFVVGEEEVVVKFQPAGGGGGKEGSFDTTPRQETTHHSGVVDVSQYFFVAERGLMVDEWRGLFLLWGCVLAHQEGFEKALF